MEPEVEVVKPVPSITHQHLFRPTTVPYTPSKKWLANKQLYVVLWCHHNLCNRITKLCWLVQSYNINVKLRSVKVMTGKHLRNSWCYVQFGEHLLGVCMIAFQKCCIMKCHPHTQPRYRHVTYWFWWIGAHRECIFNLKVKLRFLVTIGIYQLNFFWN